MSSGPIPYDFEPTFTEDELQDMADFDQTEEDSEIELPGSTANEPLHTSAITEVLCYKITLMLQSQRCPSRSKNHTVIAQVLNDRQLSMQTYWFGYSK